MPHTLPLRHSLCQLCLLLLSFVSHVALAQQDFSGTHSYALLNDSEQPQVSVLDGIFYLEDPSQTLTITELLSSARSQAGAPQRHWQRNGDSIFNQSFSTSDWWLRFSVHNDTARPQQRILEIGYPLLDQVDIFQVDGSRIVAEWHVGDHQPFAQRPILDNVFALHVSVPANAQHTFILRVRTDSAVQVPISLWSLAGYHLQDSRDNLRQGLFYGALLVIVVYNLLIFLALNESVYLLYTGFVMGMISFNASLSGHGFEWLWPNNVALNTVMVPMSISLVVLFALMFTNRFLNLPKIAPRWNQVNIFLMATGLIGLFGAVFLPYRVSHVIIIPHTMIAILLSLITGLICWRRGNSSARYYTIAWISVLLGSLVLALNKMNLMPMNAFTEHSFQIGAVMEAVLLSFALAERISTERKLRYVAQQQTLESARELNASLERRVEERTAELETLNQRLQALSETDALTGIRNRRAFETRLQEEQRRARREEATLAVAMLDIDHFKQVNDTYGHLVGDECIRRVAQHIRDNIREGCDIAGRWGGEEFCLLMPNTSADGATVVLERIRTAVAADTIRCRNQSVTLTISAGIADLPPKCADAIMYRVELADQALYESKEQGRNRVTVYPAEKTPASLPEARFNRK